MNEKLKARESALSLINNHRWAALATIDTSGYPHASMIAYAVTESTLLLHLSQLAAHSRHLVENPHCSVVITEHEIEGRDPQQLARVSIEGKIELIERDANNYQQSKQDYIQRLPDSVMLFDFSDFALMQFIPEKARYVGGFGKAYSFNRQQLLPFNTSSSES